MPAANALKALWLAYLSQPAGDRLVYRALRKTKARKIVEIGIGEGLRALRMISLAQRYHPEAEICYTGLDMFEDRTSPAGLGLSLKQAYRLLRATKAKINLVPGELDQALARVANVLTGNELIVFSADRPAEALARAWYFLPRMLASGATVFFRTASDENSRWRTITVAEMQSLAADPTRRRAA